MAETAINVPVKTRTHELNQLHEFFPAVERELREVELDEAAEEVTRIYETHVEGVTVEPRESDDFAAYVSMPAEDWRIALRHFNRLRRDHAVRVEWLQSKLVDRLEDRLAEMD